MMVFCDIYILLKATQERFINCWNHFIAYLELISEQFKGLQWS